MVPFFIAIHKENFLGKKNKNKNKNTQRDYHLGALRSCGTNSPLPMLHCHEACFDMKFSIFLTNGNN